MICCRFSHRIVTIGPFILLGLLAVTFHIGSRPVRPRVETLDDLSSRSKHGGTLGSRTGAVVDEGPSAPTNNDVPDTQSGNVTEQGQESRERGVTGDQDKSPTQPSGLASAVQNSWVIHMSGGPTGNLNTPASGGRINRPVAASERSIRSVWKAGPGNKTGGEQVSIVPEKKGDGGAGD